MSYCRWSSDDFRCDLYVYANVSGAWTIHVADYRYTNSEPIPEIDWSLLSQGSGTANVEEFMRQHKAQSDWLETAVSEPIGLPFDGETFDLASPGECADKIEELVAFGYRCPDNVADELRAEQAEMDKENPG